MGARLRLPRGRLAGSRGTKREWRRDGLPPPPRPPRHPASDHQRQRRASRPAQLLPLRPRTTDPAQTSFTKKFTGHERGSNGTGTAGDLDYMHARYCSPTLGRFLSFDPIGGNPRAPQSWNRYSYALNSPINYTDPEGLFAQLFLDLYFVVFDEITVTASSYSSLLGYFYRLGYYFSEGVRPSIYGDLGRPTPPAAGVSRALLEGDELERVRFGMTYGAIDTGGVPEFVIFLPVGRISKALGGLRRGMVPGRVNAAVRFEPSRAGHVFREAVGHVNPGSAGSQARFAQLFENVASNPANLRADAVQAGLITQQAAEAGLQAFTWAGRSGQVWVTVRNGVIQNAGVNPLGTFR
ncbi:MAG: RHS repeat-associated core domain-containing protein [Thermoanaerobaculia bacterium]|nr:RHS repeat-associated core domain-containing protein [Thermoanaerobaculia bacterium]